MAGHPGQGGIVTQHSDTVAGELYVGLEMARASRQCADKPRQ
jgi:hypothetical protein